MATKALKFCKWSGCKTLSPNSYCEDHMPLYLKTVDDKRKEYNKTRKSSSKEGYGRDWRKVRKHYMARHPLCEIHEREGVIVPAVLVHHIKALKDGGARLDSNNLQSLCIYHHEQIHGAERWSKRI